MHYNKIIFFSLVIILCFTVILQLFSDDRLQVLVNKSGPYIGTVVPKNLGYDGSGIKIAVIDTGVDYNHPDLFGLGPEGKVVGGYDYVDNDSTPFDTNGHGTEVAGIMAADGELKGIAPKAKILAYRVSDNGESVSSDLIVKAIKQAISDGADIINISLGVNKTNSKIDDAVNEAIDNGIIVVAAAGNNGPGLSTIGSPGKNYKAITVGATYNNVTASLVATLEVSDKQFSVLPMVGTKTVEEPIVGNIVFGKYGRQKDLSGLDIEDSILLVERGSDTEGEIVYFSTKEKNAADGGAKALLVYNNQKGIFFGELLHQFTEKGYSPRIPALSMSQEEGLVLKQMLENKTSGRLDIFYNPDFVAHFSSRGPVSPFYVKPDLVAPGAFVNTTLTEGHYNLTSGTSFAAPHVSGAAALLLQKNPDLKPDEIKSLLVTTADPVSDSYGNPFSAALAGSGRVNVTKAFMADLVIQPTHLVFNLSNEKLSETKTLKLTTQDKNQDNIVASFVGEDVIGFDYEIKDDSLFVTISFDGKIFGEYEGKVIINQGDSRYTIPVVVNITEASLLVSEDDGKLFFDVSYPHGWSYAKITITDQNTGRSETTSVTPTKTTELDVFDSGSYWVEAQITSDDTVLSVYDIVSVTSKPTNVGVFDQMPIPQKAIFIIVGVIAAIVLVGIKISR